MNRIQSMALAFDILERLSDSRKIDQTQYVEALSDIQIALNISDKEYMASLDSNWHGACTPEDIKNVN